MKNKEKQDRKHIFASGNRDMAGGVSDDVLLARIRGGDAEARRVFCNRYINAVFRQVRLYFGDHVRAAECAEEVMADFLLDVLERERELSAFQLLERAVIAAKKSVAVRPGAGLSERQKKALKILEPLSPEKRLIVECHVLERVPVETLRRWLDINSKKIYAACREIEQYHEEKKGKKRGATVSGKAEPKGSGNPEKSIRRKTHVKKNTGKKVNRRKGRHLPEHPGTGPGRRYRGKR